LARAVLPVEETTEVIEYALKRVDPGAVHAYIRDATTPEIREMFETVTAGVSWPRHRSSITRTAP
jgi:hypothetical protein